MKVFKRIIILICFVSVVQKSFSFQRLSKDLIISLTDEEINGLNFETYTADDFSKAYDIAVTLINDKEHVDYRIKGTNVLGALAKELYEKVKNKRLDLDSKATEIALKKFESQSYFIDRPAPSQFLKLMKYSCQGDYSHIYDRYRSSQFFWPSLSALLVYVIVLVYCLLNRRRKNQVLFIKISRFGLLLGCILIIVFKLTCESNIQDYSFYGITM